MIALEALTKVYDDGTRAVDGLTLQVDEGQTLGLVGTSGCGKTTTLKMINRLVQPTSGTVKIDGEPVDQKPVEQLRRRIGYVIQDVGLFPHYTIAENVAVVPRLLGWEEGRISKRIDELLQMVGLDPVRYADRYPASLSGGQQQRVGLARALAADPPVVLLDEPFGALDPITREQVRGEFRALQRALRKTMVLVTHDVFEAFELCDRIALVDDGRLQQVGTPRELLFRPANDFTRHFFDANRFLLELQSLSLKEVSAYINREEGTKTPSDTPVFNPYTPFLELFEALDRREESQAIAAVRDSQNNIMAAGDAGQWLEAFNRAREVWRKGAAHD